MAEIALKWKIQPRQLTFLRACGLAHPFDGGKPTKPLANVIGYGGSAGGGKSDALIMAGIIFCLTFPNSRVGYFRRTFPQLEGPGSAIQRSMEILVPILGMKAYNAQKRRWTFPTGAILQFCHLDREDDVHNYQSQQFDVLLFDEATQFTWTQISYMQTRVRASQEGIVPFTAMASNPGNVGHAFFKAHFVQIGEPEKPHEVQLEDGTQTHMFIPARLSDNKVLEERDPTYRKKLEAQPELLRKQLLDGNWDVAEGLAFSEWRENIHVVEPFKIPDDWQKFRSLDWGYAKPYSVHWFAVDHDGRLYVYRELYGYGGKANVGTKEDPEDVAIKIMKAEIADRLLYAVADDAVFGGRQDHSPSIAEQFGNAFGSKAIHWQPVGKGPGSRVAGKLEVHHRLKVNYVDGQWDGVLPMLVVFSNCRHLIRTLPNLILDDNNQEDIDTTLEDHSYDSLRYGCMSRPIVPERKGEEKSLIQKHKEKLMKQRYMRRII